MKVVKKKVHCANTEFSSANDLIKVKLYADNGPQLELEDGSLLIFLDVSTYYTVAIDTSMTNDIDIEVLKLKYFESSDDVAGVIYDNKYNIINVEDYSYKGAHFYRFIV